MRERDWILVADDYPDHVRLIGRMLSSQPRLSCLELVAAGTVEQALALLDGRGLPHLAVLDLNLAGSSGWLVHQELSAAGGCPVLYVTAAPGSVPHAAAATALTCVLAKPVARAELDGALDLLLGPA